MRIYSQVRHKTFITYHHDDEQEVREFVSDFDDRRDAFIRRGVGDSMPGDIVNSTNTDYVMSRIRQLYLGNASVTLVLVGKCTWARRYVDWEIQASLRRGTSVTPKGLLGIVLPSAGSNPKAPERLALNLEDSNGNKGYARWYWYPERKSDLVSWIEDAYVARTARSHLINNPRDRFGYNRSC